MASRAYTSESRSRRGHYAGKPGQSQEVTAWSRAHAMVAGLNFRLPGGFRATLRTGSGTQLQSPTSTAASRPKTVFDLSESDGEEDSLMRLSVEEGRGLSPSRASSSPTRSHTDKEQRLQLDFLDGLDGIDNRANDSEAFPSFKRTSRISRLRLSGKRRLPRHCCSIVTWTLLAIFAVYAFYFWRSEKALASKWTPDRESLLFAQQPLQPPLARTLIKDYKLPLSTRGRNIVDATGRRFKLSSVNWYGASDELFAVGGLDVRHRSEIAETIRKLGFNSVRLPYADEMVMTNPIVDVRLVQANPDLKGKRAMDILEAVTTALTDAGVAVIINNHITSATWCCGADPCDAAWANDYLGGICKVKQTEDQWIENWELVMDRFIDNPLVIGVDLRNEVRGLWGTMPWRKWAAAAERCGNRLLEMKRDWLVVVEGTESANDLSGADKRPVKLTVPNRLVYSAHVYAWSGWGSTEGRFAKRDYKSFAKTMRNNWGYLLNQDVAPVWVGELGGPHRPSKGDAHYWQNLFRYLKEEDADFGYWAINPRKPHQNAKESYALVEDDWKTPVLDYRLKDMVELMRQ